MPSTNRSSTWATVDTTPATGLKAPTWSSTLHVYSLTGEVIAEPEITAPAAADGGATGILEVAGDSTGFRVKVSLPGDDPDITEIFSPSGKNLAVEQGVPEVTAVGRTAVAISYSTGDPDQVLDTTTGKVIWTAPEDTYLGERTSDQCTDNNVIYTRHDSNNKSAVRLTSSSGAMHVTPLKYENAVDDNRGFGSGIIGVFPSGTLVTNGSGNYTFYGWDGAAAWSLTSQVVQNLYVIGDWIVVENMSNANIVVDPATGEAAVGLDDDAARDIVNYDQLLPVVSDSESKTLILVESDHDVYRKVSYQELCGGGSGRAG